MATLTPRANALDHHVKDNDRTAWIFVAFMVLTFVFFAAGILGLAFWDFRP